MEIVYQHAVTDIEQLMEFVSNVYLHLIVNLALDLDVQHASILFT
jgi:hypothetical protein